MVIFHSYVSLPEGMLWNSVYPLKRCEIFSDESRQSKTFAYEWEDEHL